MSKKRTILSIIQNESHAVKARPSQEIRVTIHTPENVAENIRRQKINRIYDILNPKTSC